ncbi:MFS transporter [Actinoplanes friuliensis]|uniref:Major facilitator transporter n=1 Tax=Actinoplanes friuliensis DSM 7358 TaxID=1246995 RepID=U5W388_9ACTN|nr:MFS transporter [Actinoplanes friuliensis]AGZ42465.1 major facilitator transporter [Actinoplanes friuliensis DSM 7358]
MGLLRDPDFRRLFTATAASQLGDRVIFLALPLVAIVALSATEFQVGLLSAATMAGSLLVGLPAGAWIDRLRKRGVLVTTDLLRALVIAVIPLAWWADALSIWLLFGVALVHGVLTVFFDVAYVSYLPYLVGRDHLTEGNAKLASVRSAVSVGGPGLAGPLIGAFGAPVALVAGSAGMVVSALFVRGLRKREPAPEPSADPHLGREIAEGLRFVLGQPLLRAIVTADGLFGLFLIAYQTMLLVFLARDVQLGSFGIGVVLSAMGCGGLAGALLARRAASRLGARRVIWLAPLLTCPPAALMAFAAPGWTLWVAPAGLVLLSFGGVVRLVAQAGLQQSVTPDHVLGRMSATFRFVTWGGMPLGGLLGGAAGTWLGPSATLWLSAAGLTLTFLPTFAVRAGEHTERSVTS